MTGNAPRAVWPLLSVVAILAAAPIGYSDTGFLDRTVTSGGESHRYQVYVPIEWTAGEKWPVMIYLHGGSHQGADGMRQTTNRAAPGLADAIRSDRGRFPLLVVFPQAPGGTRWATPRTQDMVLAELEATLKQFNGDPDRVYLTGFSMGGQGVLRIASRWPHRFAALAAVAPRMAPGGNSASPAQFEEDVRSHPFLSDRDRFESFVRIVGDKPMWVFHGDSDTLTSVEESRHLIAAFKQAGATRVRYTEYPGLDHVPSCEKAFSDTELISWLLAQRRNVTSRDDR